MRSFKTYLKEIKGKPYPAKGIFAKSMATVEFETDDGREIVITAMFSDMMSYKTEPAQPSGLRQMMLIFSDDTSGNAETGITGKGDAFRIFITVGDKVQKIIERYKPDLIHFSAEEPSRIKLYTRLSKMIKGYSRSTKVNPFTGTKSIGTFIMLKDKSKKELAKLGHS